jgi:two-component system sensor histidine kinase DesK
VEVSDIEGVSRRALEDVRAAVSGYRRISLDGELEGALIALEAAGVTTDVDHQAGRLPAEVDEAFAWSVREGATNVVRHARARTTVIRTRLADRAAVLEIVNDEIRSADDAVASPRGKQRTGSGLTGLGERVAAVGGRIETSREPDGGFRLTVTIPLPATPA